MFDALLVAMEHERDGTEPADSALLQLRRDRYNEGDGSLLDQAYKRGWNHGSRHAEGIRLIERGLTELRRQVAFLDERFDHSEQSEDIG